MEDGEAVTSADIVSFGRYLKFMLLMLIPVVGLVYCAIKSDDSSESTSYRNMCTACLVTKGIVIAIASISFVIFIACVLSSMIMF